jgi:hypothetical protein
VESCSARGELGPCGKCARCARSAQSHFRRRKVQILLMFRPKTLGAYPAPEVRPKFWRSSGGGLWAHFGRTRCAQSFGPQVLTYPDLAPTKTTLGASGASGALSSFFCPRERAGARPRTHAREAWKNLRGGVARWRRAVRPVVRSPRRKRTRVSGISSAGSGATRATWFRAWRPVCSGGNAAQKKTGRRGVSLPEPPGRPVTGKTVPRHSYYR